MLCFYGILSFMIHGRLGAETFALSGEGLLAPIRIAPPVIRSARFGNYVPGPGFITDLEDTPLWPQLDNYDRKRLDSYRADLNNCHRFGYIDLSQVRSIIDFGAGDGTPTLISLRLAELNGGTVDALELHKAPAQVIVDRGILPPERVHDGDGLDFLQAMASRGETCDLITVFHGGPFSMENEDLARNLLVAASWALAPGGHLFITSDSGSIRFMERLFTAEGIDYQNEFGTLITDFTAACDDTSRPYHLV
jgi:hypothetical protein